MIARTIHKATLGSIAGLLASLAASASLSSLIGKPIAGCACITIAILFGAFGALAGAAAEEF